MKRFYLIPLVFLILGLLVPAMYASKLRLQSPPNQIKMEAKKGSNLSADSSGQDGAVTGTSPERLPMGETGLKPRTAPVQQDTKESKNPVSQDVLREPDERPVASQGAVVIGIAVVGKEGELLFGPAEVKVAKENTWGITALGALDATGISYTISTRFSDFVESIAGQRNRGQSGWMYKVNEEVPLVAAAKRFLKQGDRVIWWYSKSMDQPPPSWEEMVNKR